MNLIQDWLLCEYQTKEKVAPAFGPFVTLEYVENLL